MNIQKVKAFSVAAIAVVVGLSFLNSSEKTRAAAKVAEPAKTEQKVTDNRHNEFMRKMETSCLSARDVADETAKNYSLDSGQRLNVRKGAYNLCVAAYQQASADFPADKAIKQANGNPIVEGIIRYAYTEYEANN